MAYAIIAGNTEAARGWITGDPIAGPSRMTFMPQSAIYEGWVTHRRFAPRCHAFRYRVFALLLDLDELQVLSQLRLFRWNKPGVTSFRDRDHGDGRDLGAWLDRVLAAEGISAKGAKRVLCYPRLLGYVFNPLSVWFCHNENGDLAAIVYEVHNTYGERHTYVLRADDQRDVIRHRCAKSFYVSPFLSMDCTYDFKVRAPADSVLVAINENEAGHLVLAATFSGKRKPLSDASLAGLLLRHPLMTLKVIAAIHFEAMRLMLKGLNRHGHVSAPSALRH